MKQLKYFLVVFLLLVSTSVSLAYFENLQHVTFNSDASIADGTYASVTVNGTANLSVTGGTIGGIVCNDNTTININGGNFVGGFSEPTGEFINGLPVMIYSRA